MVYFYEATVTHSGLGNTPCVNRALSWRSKTPAVNFPRILNSFLYIKQSVCVRCDNNTLTFFCVLNKQNSHRDKMWVIRNHEFSGRWSDFKRFWWHCSFFKAFHGLLLAHFITMIIVVNPRFNSGNNPVQNTRQFFIKDLKKISTLLDSHPFFAA